MSTWIADQRIDVRLSSENKELIEHAAAIDGTSVSAFVLGTALGAARQVLAEHDRWLLSRRDSAAFVEALINPPEPNEALNEAAARYKENIPMDVARSVEPITAIFSDGTRQIVCTGPDSIPVTVATAGQIILELQDKISSHSSRAVKPDPYALPLKMIPEGWAFHCLEMWRGQTETWACFLCDPEWRIDERLGTGHTPRAAFEAACAAAGEVG